MMIHERVRMFFQLIEKCDSETKHWVAKAIGYAAAVDGVVQPSEAPYLTAMFAILKSDGLEVAPVVQTIMKTHPRPPLVPVQLEPSLAEEILKFVLEICWSDEILEENEHTFIQELGKALSLSESKLKELMNNRKPQPR